MRSGATRVAPDTIAARADSATLLLPDAHCSSLTRPTAPCDVSHRLRIRQIPGPQAAMGSGVLRAVWAASDSLGRYNRLSKDAEQRTERSEAVIRIAMIHLML